MVWASTITWSHFVSWPNKLEKRCRFSETICFEKFFAFRFQLVKFQRIFLVRTFATGQWYQTDTDVVTIRWRTTSCLPFQLSNRVLRLMLGNFAIIWMQHLTKPKLCLKTVINNLHEFWGTINILKDLKRFLNSFSGLLFTFVISYFVSVISFCSDFWSFRCLNGIEIILVEFGFFYCVSLGFFQ